MSINSILHLARTALSVNQAAIDTTSNNIANVNTPGYSRQRVDMITGAVAFDGKNFMSGGVSIENIERVYDRFINAQILDSKEALAENEARNGALSRLEIIYTDFQDTGLDALLSQFFNSLNDVANDPQSQAGRSILLASANTLADKIQSLETRSGDELANVDDQIGAVVDDINSLATRIAELNLRILQNESSTQEANTLRDERTRLVEELASKVDVEVLEESSGTVKVLMARGAALVAGGDATTLSRSTELNADGIQDVVLGDFIVTDNISSGALRGLLDVRTGIHTDTLEKLDLLAASLTKEFNIMHRAGYGLDGVTGRDLFNNLTPTTSLGVDNGGGGVVSASVADLSALTLDDYEIRFSSATTYNVYNTTDGTTVASGQGYVSGATIAFEGLEVVISDGTSAPLAGDSFKVSVTTNAARLFSVAIDDNDHFAAATDPTLLPGDNSNVLAMTDLEDALSMGGGTTTFSDYFRRIVSDVGSAANHASINETSQRVVVEELEGYRASITSVSMDEEGVNLIKFQHAYAAAARVVTTVDSLFETVLRM